MNSRRIRKEGGVLIGHELVIEPDIILVVFRSIGMVFLWTRLILGVRPLSTSFVRIIYFLLGPK